MEKIFDEILKTENGQQIIFNIVSTAMIYKQASQRQRNPFVKQLGKDTIDAQRVRKLLFQNLDDFESLVGELYTFDKSVQEHTEGLTSGSE